MSYEVTATRRRPQRFEDLVGQEFVAETLKNSIKSGKIAHAYLFTGPRGCGKTSSARILAKALNCEHGPSETPCGQCSNCQEITKGTSLDVIEIDGASNNNVDNIRQIKEEVMFPPTNCRYKIYIIDEVHMLSTSAFNALLKTIEEPPEHVIFIFATTELQKVPATIKSRCQQFNFRLVPIEKVKNCLAEAAAELNISADDEALFWIARESTGSMRDAYTLFDQVVAFSGDHITYEKIRDKLGLVGIDRLNSIFELAAAKQTEQVIEKLDEFLQNGISIEQLISNCADYIRSLLLLKNGITRESLLGNAPERYSKQVLSAWNSVQLERGLSLFLNLYRDIRYSLSPRYELDLLFSRMCWLCDYVSPAEVKKAIDAAQALLAGAPVSAPQQVQQMQTAQAPQQVQSAQSVQSAPQMQASAGNAAKNTAGTSSPVATPIDQLPDYMKFSALQGASFDTMEQVPPVEAEPPVENDNPFSDGGAEPPEQTAAPTEPPSFSDPYEQPEENAENIPDQSGEMITTAQGQSMSIQELRRLVTNQLSLSEGFAASGLKKTGFWKVNENGIRTSVNSAYDLDIIRKKNRVIADCLSSIYGKPMSFFAELQEVKQESVDNAPKPLQVEILCKAFSGHL
ncbi:MAG: DNA polymerase III subunit gamma/tau [Treponema sp.]|nr:DNA polymerase III subunit gamma/tau [Treponema sp.]